MTGEIRSKLTFIEQDQRKTQNKENQFSEYVNFTIFSSWKSNSPHNRMAILGIDGFELN